MNIQGPSRIARQAILCFRGVRHATTVAASTEPPANLADTPVTSSEIIATPEAPPATVFEAPEDGTEHGQTIYVFNHLQKQHVVYSLTRALNVHPLTSFAYANRPRLMKYRTTLPCPNSPSTARKQFPAPSGKISGPPSQPFTSHPPPSVSVPSKNYGNIVADTS